MRRPRSVGERLQGRPLDGTALAWSTPDQIRAELASWPHDELVDFAARKIENDPEEMLRFQALAAGRREPERVQAAIQVAIDRALSVKFVRWNQVSGFVHRLEGILAEVQAWGRGDPHAGFLLTRYFIEAIPKVFDAIDDETELAIFCEDLVRACLKLVVKAREPIQAVAEWLLSVYFADDYYRFGSVPALFVEARLGRRNRETIAALLEARASNAEPCRKVAMEGAARELLHHQTRNHGTRPS